VVLCLFYIIFIVVPSSVIRLTISLVSLLGELSPVVSLLDNYLKHKAIIMKRNGGKC
jgi:hypothetical protein